MAYGILCRMGHRSSQLLRDINGECTFAGRPVHCRALLLLHMAWVALEGGEMRDER